MVQQSHKNAFPSQLPSGFSRTGHDQSCWMSGAKASLGMNPPSPHPTIPSWKLQFSPWLRLQFQFGRVNLYANERRAYGSAAPRTLGFVPRMFPALFSRDDVRGVMVTTMPQEASLASPARQQLSQPQIPAFPQPQAFLEGAVFQYPAGNPREISLPHPGSHIQGVFGGGSFNVPERIQGKFVPSTAANGMS